MEKLEFCCGEFGYVVFIFLELVCRRNIKELVVMDWVI